MTQMNADVSVFLPRSGETSKALGRSRLRRSPAGTSAFICVICG
jgi:hypothetical protein